MFHSLKKILDPYLSKWNHPVLHSRVHLLQGFGDDFWVKRDDELSFGASGSKVRKFASLISALKEGAFHEVAVIGGHHSNSVLASAQFLREAGIPFHGFLFGRGDLDGMSNGWFRELLWGDYKVTWVGNNEKESPLEKARTYQKYQMEVGHKVFVLPEGASCRESIPGGLTLACDILTNEYSHGLRFENIVIDSGTGFMAHCLYLGMAYLKRSPKIHVVLMAENEESFMHNFERLKADTIRLFGALPEGPKPTFCFYKPVTAKSFGAVNATVFNEVRNLAVSEGILADPVYNAKLFMTARQLRGDGQLQGESLIIHSGGTLSLSGFA